MKWHSGVDLKPGSGEILLISMWASEPAVTSYWAPLTGVWAIRKTLLHRLISTAYIYYIYLGSHMFLQTTL